MTTPQAYKYERLIFWIVLTLATFFLAITSKGAEPTPPAWCVQIDVKDAYGSSHGSGSLVSPSLVLTNNHVVKDRQSNTVKVWFPNGDIVDGQVIKVDRINDIAAIRIASSLRPYIKLGSNLQIGETLTLHGYAGKQTYRSDTGVVSKFESPTRAGPNTFVLVQGATARNGDSGGPLVKSDGTLGGVLFGSTRNTSGVRISCVRKFINEVAHK